MNILITGGAGFIGTNFCYYLDSLNRTDDYYVIFDKLTYAGNKEYLEPLLKKDNFDFCFGDICKYPELKKVIRDLKIDTVVHFAAESHVDNSIAHPDHFIETNIKGTFRVLEEVKDYKLRLHHVSTDEVYGSLGKKGYFYEKTPYDPKSPYSASKASSDHLVRAYGHTYGIKYTISNCSNNYGPYQHREKLIPLTINRILNNKPIPVYGKGDNVRDWLYVEDHCSAIWKILTEGKLGETYNIGGNCEKNNLEIVNTLCAEVAICRNESPNKYKSLITFVEDRKGHDFRYAINCDKLKGALKWAPRTEFKDGIKQTVEWYMRGLK
ncbi:MAG: dTDP-glucose 4,6-dehydratase [Candidatus Paceibacterota bacterium]|jgi:dTDP-glucose 4,6-dehydratase